MDVDCQCLTRLDIGGEGQLVCGSWGRGSELGRGRGGGGGGVEAYDLCCSSWTCVVALDVVGGGRE